MNVPKVDVELNNGAAGLTGVKTQNLKLDIKKGDFRAVRSTLAGSQVFVSHGDAVIQKSKLSGQNSFVLTDGDFKMKYSPQLNYDLTGDSSGNIFFQGDKQAAHYVKQASGSDSLKVSATKGKVRISK